MAPKQDTILARTWEVAGEQLGRFGRVGSKLKTGLWFRGIESYWHSRWIQTQFISFKTWQWNKMPDHARSVWFQNVLKNLACVGFLPYWSHSDPYWIYWIWGRVAMDYFPVARRVAMDHRSMLTCVTRSMSFLFGEPRLNLASQLRHFHITLLGCHNAGPSAPLGRGPLAGAFNVLGAKRTKTGYPRWLAKFAFGRLHLCRESLQALALSKQLANPGGNSRSSRCQDLLSLDELAWSQGWALHASMGF